MAYCTAGLDVSLKSTIPNADNGIYVSESAGPVEVSDCVAGGNGISGIRHDGVDDGSDVDAMVNRVIDSGPLANGWRLEACTLCLCTPDASDAAAAAGTVVDCRIDPATNTKRSSGGSSLGPNFPARLPSNTTVLRLSSTGLQQVDWDSFWTGTGQTRQPALPRLHTLDLSDNPDLDPLPATGRFDLDMFPALTTLSLRGTRLARLANDSFSALGGAEVAALLTGLVATERRGRRR